MKVLYFSWLKEKIGKGEEQLDLPEGVSDVQSLLDWMKGRGDGFTDAFANDAIIRVAVNHEYVERNHAVQTGDEIAIFPPVTGG